MRFYSKPWAKPAADGAADTGLFSNLLQESCINGSMARAGFVSRNRQLFLCANLVALLLLIGLNQPGASAGDNGIVDIDKVPVGNHYPNKMAQGVNIPIDINGRVTDVENTG